MRTSEKVHLVYKDYIRSGEAFTEFFFFFVQKMSAVNKAVSDPDVRQAFIETWHMEIQILNIKSTY